VPLPPRFDGPWRDPRADDRRGRARAAPPARAGSSWPRSWRAWSSSPSAPGSPCALRGATGAPGSHGCRLGDRLPRRRRPLPTDERGSDGGGDVTSRRARGRTRARSTPGCPWRSTTTRPTPRPRRRRVRLRRRGVRSVGRLQRGQLAVLVGPLTGPTAPTRRPAPSSPTTPTASRGPRPRRR